MLLLTAVVVFGGELPLITAVTVLLRGSILLPGLTVSPSPPGLVEWACPPPPPPPAAGRGMGGEVEFEFEFELGEMEAPLGVRLNLGRLEGLWMGSPVIKSNFLFLPTGETEE